MRFLVLAAVLCLVAAVTLLVVALVRVDECAESGTVLFPVNKTLLSLPTCEEVP